MLVVWRESIQMIYLAVATDCFHAFLMMLWVLGLPLLFWHKFPKLSLTYCCFSLAFIIVNQLSQYFLGECIFTTIANYFYQQANDLQHSNEWFTVRASKMIFGLTPSHYGIKIATEILIGISTVGGIFSLYRKYKIRRISSQSPKKDK